MHVFSFSGLPREKRREGTVGCGHLAELPARRRDAPVEAPIDHHDVTTIMGMLGDIRNEVIKIRRLLEEDDGEEEANETNDT
jgi:hypothetical protein